MYPPSPCTGVCQIDPATGLCLGCARTAAEIAAWRDAAPHFLEKVWEELPARRAQLGITVARLGWTQATIQRFVARSLLDRSGTWVFGIYGATAEFSIEDDDIPEIDVRDHTVVASTERGAVRFEISAGIRALALAGPARPGEYARSSLPFRAAC
jgi:predicted Fe-S protein YdhL (DUF1289 family)